MKQILLINPEEASKNEVKKYSTREAVRAIVIDNAGLIGLVHSVKNNHYKIPGGGIENNENHEIALKRECREEIGTDIEIIEPLGSIKEYRKTWKLVQISYCYIAKVKGDKKKPQYMFDEIEEGFEAVWMPYQLALKSISLNRSRSFEGKEYIVPRDSTFLLYAKDKLLKVK